jgi:hypothetical protein
MEDDTPRPGPANESQMWNSVAGDVERMFKRSLLRADRQASTAILGETDAEIAWIECQLGRQLARASGPGCGRPDLQQGLDYEITGPDP